MKKRPTPAVFYSDNSAVQIRSAKVPSFVFQVLLGKYSPGYEDFKSVSPGRAYKHLLQVGRQSRKSGASYLEVLFRIWIRSLERCLEPVADEALLEIAARAMSEFDEFAIPDYETIIRENWKLVPGDLRLYFKDKPLRLHIHQLWVLYILLEKSQQGEAGMLSSHIVSYINERQEQQQERGENVKILRAKDLHNIAFKKGSDGDVLIGKGRLIDTGGRGGESYVRLNWNWNPLKDLNPRVKKIFSSD